MKQLDRDLPVLDPVAADGLDRVVIQRAEAALVRTGLGQQRIQAVALIAAQPQAQRRHAEPTDRAIGQLVLTRRDACQHLAGHLVGQRARRLRDQSVAKHCPVAMRGPSGRRLVFNHAFVLRACRVEGISPGLGRTMSPVDVAAKTDCGMDSQ